MSPYAFFWGCQIQSRFPFMEKSTRLMMDQLQIDYRDIDGFTCCPEKSLTKNLNADLWPSLRQKKLLWPRQRALT